MVFHCTIIHTLRLLENVTRNNIEHILQCYHWYPTFFDKRRHESNAAVAVAKQLGCIHCEIFISNSKHYILVVKLIVVIILYFINVTKLLCTIAIKPIGIAIIWYNTQK